MKTTVVTMTGLLVIGGVLSPAIWAESRRGGVPMTRPEEALAVLDGVGSKASFVELPDGSILVARGNGRFSTSKDGGLTWSKQVQFYDVAGQPLDGGGASLVRLSGSGIGYASRVVSVEEKAAAVGG